MTNAKTPLILAGKRNIGSGCSGGMTALWKHLHHDGYNPIMVQTRSTMEYGYGIDEWRIYV